MSCALNRCKVCQEPAAAYASVEVRNSHKTEIFACSVCGFVYLEPVYWLEEAYRIPITPLDVGYVSRNLAAARYLSRLLGDKTVRSNFFVDFGGGCGLLVRLMRDRGFRFHLYDRYKQNIFAWNCDADPSTFGSYRAVTAIEVFEHLPDPATEIREMLNFGNTIIFTTELCPNPKPLPEEWWYFGLEHGQHVSFYTESSLKTIAKRHGLVYRSLGKYWHIMSPVNDPVAKPVSDDGRSWMHAFSGRASRLAKLIKASKGTRLDALIEHDFEAMKRILDESGQEQLISQRNIDEF